MKTVVCHSNYAILNKNGNMLNGRGNVSVKDFLMQMSALKKDGLANYLIFKTSDEIQLDQADSFLFIDMPDATDPYYITALNTRKPLYLLAWESGIINTGNANPGLHNSFLKVFTYDDRLVDKLKYIKVAYSFVIPSIIPREFNSKKLCCMVTGNKVSSHPLELYSARRQIIDWFEKFQANEFDLYGQGWNKTIPANNLWQRIENNLPFRFRKVSPNNYRGEVIDKFSVLKKYKFSVCYENARDLPGYISEKVFDCLFAGCIPIYLGAPNISDYIPEDCFVDRRKFSDLDELFSFISSMSECDYSNYLDRIENFFNENQDGLFSTKYFTKTLIDEINLGFLK